MVSREEFKKKLLNLLNNSNLSKKLDKNTGESKGSPFSMGGSKWKIIMLRLMFFWKQNLNNLQKIFINLLKLLKTFVKNLLMTLERKALSLEIVEYYKRPGFDKNKYKQFADKLQKYDKELYKLKQTMSEEQYNRILEEYYRTQGNLEALNAEMMKQLNAQIEEEKRGNIKL